MAQPANELQTRTCRACGQAYSYPVIRNRATRFHCETCAELPEPVRETFEKFAKRIKELERRLAARPAPGKSDAR